VKHRCSAAVRWAGPTLFNSFHYDVKKTLFLLFMSIHVKSRLLCSKATDSLPYFIISKIVLEV
jgi:hypothetical protein